MKYFIWVFIALVAVSCGENKKKEKIEIKENKPGQKMIKPSDVVMGDYAFIEMGVKNTFEESKAFYEILGFTEVKNQFKDENMMMMTDSNLVIVLNKASIAPAMLIYLNENLVELEQKISKTGILVHKVDDFIEVKSPDGIKVTVLNMSSEGLFRPTSKSMMELMTTNEIGNPKLLPNKKMGVFGEFSHQIANFDKSLQWWANLGIIGQGIMEFGYKFSIIYDKQVVIGLHERQNSKWLGSAITYFATDQEVRLEKLKKELDPSLINESEELGPGNAIIKSPEGNLVFVFKL